MKEQYKVIKTAMYGTSSYGPYESHKEAQAALDKLEASSSDDECFFSIEKVDLNEVQDPQEELVRDNYFRSLNVLIQFVLRVISAISGGIITVALVVAFIFVLFSTLDYLDITEGSYRFRFPVRAIFTFFIGAFYFWIKTPVFYNILSDKYNASLPFRYFVLLSIFYTICLLSFVHLFEPRPFNKGLELYRYGRLDNDFWELLKWLLYPIFIIALGSFFYSKARVKEE